MPNTLPAIVANPPTMTAWSSLSVISAMKGLTSKGASVWPIKILPAAESDSDADVPKMIERK